MDDPEDQQSDAERWEASCRVFSAIPGATELISAYGKMPSFHDGEVEVVQFATNGPSTICIAIPDQMLVTFKAAQVIDVALQGFERQNILWELWARTPTAKPGFNVCDGDMELELDAVAGIGGTVWLRGVEVSWAANTTPVVDDFGGAWAD